MNECKELECREKVKGSGYCKNHRKRFSNKGVSIDTENKTYNVNFIFDNINSISEDCIDWPYGQANGYGTVRYNGKNWGTHRLCLFLSEGFHQDEERKLACHSCGNRLCVNVNHLYWGTYTDNAQDKVRHGRAKNKKMRALTNEEALEILESNLIYKELAKKYKVSVDTISGIKRRIYYKDVVWPKNN